MSLNPLAGVLDARETIVKVIERYRSLATYRDEGVVRTFWLFENQPALQEVSFTTFFSRPRTLRFEWVTHHPYPPLRHIRTRHMIVCDEAGARYEDDSPEKESMENLALAVAAATGVSSGSASTVVNLLSDEIGAFSPLDLQNLRFGEPATIGGVGCLCVIGEHPLGRTTELFFGIADRLLRKHVTHDSTIRVEENRSNLQTA